MSLSLWTMACGAIGPRSQSLAHVAAYQARMHPQSTGDPVLRLHSCRALSPESRRQSNRTPTACHQRACLPPPT